MSMPPTKLNWHTDTMSELDRFIFAKLMEREDCRHFLNVGTNWRDGLININGNDIDYLCRLLVGDGNHALSWKETCCHTCIIPEDPKPEISHDGKLGDPAQTVINDLLSQTFCMDLNRTDKTTAWKNSIINSYAVHAVKHRVGLTPIARETLSRFIGNRFDAEALQKVLEYSYIDPNVWAYDKCGYLTNASLARFHEERLSLCQVEIDRLAAEPLEGPNFFREHKIFVDFDSLLAYLATFQKSNYQPKPFNHNSPKRSIKERFGAYDMTDQFVALPIFVIKNRAEFELSFDQLVLIAVIADMKEFTCTINQILDAMGYTRSNRSKIYRHIRWMTARNYVIVTDVGNNRRHYDFMPLWAKYNQLWDKQKKPKLVVSNGQTVVAA